MHKCVDLPAPPCAPTATPVDAATHLINLRISFSRFVSLHQNGLPGDFTFSLSAFPPFEEVGPGATVPDILLTCPIQRDEPPDPVSVANFLDDANLLFRSHCLPSVMRKKWRNAWCLFFDFHRHHEHIKCCKLRDYKRKKRWWRRVRDSNPQALSGAGFQDRCNSQFCQLSARCAGYLKRAHPITSKFGFQRSSLWACFVRRFKASMRIAMPLKAIDQRLRPQEE